MSAAYSADALDESREELAREAAMLFSVAEGHLNDGAADEAERAATEALKLFRELGDRKAVADTLRILISVRRVRGDLEAAERLAKEELERCEESEDSFGEAAMLLSLAELTSDIMALNEVAQDRLVSSPAACQLAIKFSKEAQGIFADMDDKKMEASALLAMMGAYRDASMPKEAMEAANDALVIYRGIKDKRGEAMALHAVALAYSMVEKWQDALKISKMARSLFQESGVTSLEASELYFIGQWHMMLEEFDQMVRQEQECLELFQGIDHIKGEAAAFKLTIEALFFENKEDAALDLAEELLSKFKDKGSKMGEAAALDAQAKCYDLKGDRDKAIELATKTLAAVREVGDRKWESAVLNRLAIMQLDANNFGQAGEAINEAIGIFQASGDKASEAQALLQVRAEVAAGANDIEGAFGALGGAQGIFTQLDDKKGLAMTYYSTAALLHKINYDLDNAETNAKNAREIFEQLGESLSLIYTLHLLHLIFIAKKNPEEATRVIHEVHLLSQKEKDKTLEANVLIFTVAAHFAVLGKLADDGGTRESRTFTDTLGKAEKAANSALKLAEKLEDLDIKANATYTLAEVNLYAQSFNEALQGCEEAEKLYTESGGKAGQCTALILKATVQQFLGRMQESMNASTEALEIAQEIGDAQLQAQAQERLDKVRGTQMQMGNMMMQQMEAAPVAEAEPEVASAIEPEKPKGLDALIVGDMLHGMLREMVGVQMESDTPFMDAGVDSLMSIEFRSQVNQAFSGLSLASTLTFDYPTIRELTAHVVEKSENQ